MADTPPTDYSTMAEHAAEAVALLKELANQNRLMICCVLVGGELSVAEINQQIPLSQSALSQHLARLRLAGLVDTRKDAQTVFYRLAGDRVMQVMSTLKSMYCPE